MTESIFVRVQRVISAGADGAVGAAERVTGTSLMRQAIREVDQAIDETCEKQAAAKARGSQAARRQRLLRERLATLDEQARFAVGKGRDDLAEAALARQLDFEAQAAQLKAAEAEAAKEAVRLDEALAQLKLRRAQMEQELAAFQAARDSGFGLDGAAPVDRTERKVARAQAAFERAMAAAGGIGLGDAGAAAKLAEVAELQKADEIAERLAALRARQDGASGKKRAPGAGKGR